ncbi:MAG: hypothetical protein ACFE9S_14810 [Candidatus Hermodarchaeota archaeon]
MAWTPPSKFIVVITFLLWGFGLFILLDQFLIFWAPPLLPIIHPFGWASPTSWMLIAMIVFFFSWFLFFLGVTLKGL